MIVALIFKPVTQTLRLPETALGKRWVNNALAVLHPLWLGVTNQSNFHVDDCSWCNKALSPLRNLSGDLTGSKNRT